MRYEGEGRKGLVFYDSKAGIVSEDNWEMAWSMGYRAEGEPGQGAGGRGPGPGDGADSWDVSTLLSNDGHMFVGPHT